MNGYASLEGAARIVVLGVGGGGSNAVNRMIQAGVGVVTKPFTFEGRQRAKNADEGITQLRDRVDTLITIPNDRLLEVIDRKTTLEQAFMEVDDVLRQGIQGISELITEPGLINLDFADVKSIMSDSGGALMAIGRGTGETRAQDAARMAISSPLLDISMDGAKGVLLNITGGNDLALSEISDAADVVAQAADPEASIIFGAVIDPKIENEVRITVIATGFDVSDRPRQSLYRTRLARPAYGTSVEKPQPAQEQPPASGRDRGLPVEERD